MSNLFKDALNWAQTFGKDTDAMLNIDSNRRTLLVRMREACQAAGFAVETIKQDAIAPALHVAVQLGDQEHSRMIEQGGDTWSDIVFTVLTQLSSCDEATVFVQLEARQARVFVCCTQHHDGSERQRHVTLVNVTDSQNLVDAYLRAKSHR